VTAANALATAVPSPDTVVGADGLVFAAFGRRLAALVLDAAVLGLAVVLVVEVLRSVAGSWSPFEAPWRSPDVVAVESGAHSRDAARTYTGALRETEQFWEMRRYADGSARIFGVAASRITAADGAVETIRLESEIGRDLRTLVRRWLTWGFLALLPFAYFAAFEGSRWQASPGKLALGLEVVDRHGRRIGVLRSLARQGLKLVEIGSTGLGYLLAAMTGRRQAFHDVVAGTYVVVSKRGEECGSSPS
jgi:uncharacterized RDD family membrane protein YckC